MTETPRLMLAAPASGSGKTTLTIALLQALLNRGLRPASFKCGPDYIDPMFHAEVLGLSGHNLDLFFTPPEIVRGLLGEGAQGADIAVLEGVMGYYDGAGPKGEASSWQVAVETQTPAVLVVKPGGASTSVAALVQGFARFKQNSMLRGVILNNCSEGLCDYIKPVIEECTGLRVYGCLPPMPQSTLESRHLGLVTPGEMGQLREKIGQLAAQLEKTVDVDGLLALAQTASPLKAELPAIAPVATGPGGGPVSIAVARDEAFCFYYRENLELLEALGVQLVYFSPLRDAALPAGMAGLYIGGGYPELHAAKLAQNAAMRESVRSAIAAGLPTLAECGGFMYLQQTLRDEQGVPHPMVAALPGEAQNSGRLGRFGYVTLQAQKDTLLCPKGESIRGHEFHYWDSDANGEVFWAQKPYSERGWACGQGSDSLTAGYPHFYFWSNPHAAARFVQKAVDYAAEAHAAASSCPPDASSAALKANAITDFAAMAKVDPTDPAAVHTTGDSGAKP